MAAEPSIKLNAWESNLCSIIRARQPGVMVQSLEEPRVLHSITRVHQWMAERGLGVRELFVWSKVQTRKINVLKPREEQPPNLDKPFFEAVRDVATREHVDPNDPDSNPYMATLVLTDCGDELQSPTNVRMLREALWAVRGSVRTVIVLGKPFNLPDEIADDLTILPFDLPTAKDLQEVFTPIINAYKENDRYKDVPINEKLIPTFARACAGLPEVTASGLMGLSVVRYNAFDDRAIGMALTEKANVVRRTNIVEYETPEGSLNDIGGLENVKAWIREQDALFAHAEEAKKYGLDLPKGFMAAGISGTGKSMCSRLIAAHWKLPLLKVDLGRAFGSLVGESEANLRRIFDICKAVAPVCVLFDEFEKAIGGRGGDLDGGTSERVKGALLTWLAERPDSIFTIMTVNDVTKFEGNPELLGAHRIDKIFFVDLPDFRTRLEIMKIHSRKAGHDVSAETLMDAAKATRAYNGAELRVIVQTALRAAFNASPRLVHPTSEMFVKAAHAQKPLSQTMKESVQALRAWCKEGRAVPAGATLEDDETSDMRAFKERGLPDLVK